MPNHPGPHLAKSLQKLLPAWTAFEGIERIYTRILTLPSPIKKIKIVQWSLNDDRYGFE
jgi:hypothetical protein